MVRWCEVFFGAVLQYRESGDIYWGNSAPCHDNEDAKLKNN
jgi:hypothetical protein